MTPRMVAVAAMMVAACAAGARAQRVQPEVRADLIGPSPYAAHAGAGFVVPLGAYARVSLDGAGGARRVGDTWRAEWRGDVLARATLDPFREERWALSIGGGISVRQRAYLLAVLDLEGPAMRGMVPAFQAGVGGGVRAGVVLRRAVPGRR